MRRKSSLTLLELILVISIASLLVGAGTLQIPRFLAHERFEKEVKLVQQKIELAQELMLDFETDITLQLLATDAGTTLKLLSTKPLKKRWNRKEMTLKQIKQIAFDREKTDDLKLLYDCQMGGCPKGNLKLIGKKKEVTLFLPGYPGKIKRGEKLEDGKNAPYPQEMFSLT